MSRYISGIRRFNIMQKLKNKMGDLRLRIEMKIGSPNSMLERFEKLDNDAKNYCIKFLPDIFDGFEEYHTSEDLERFIDIIGNLSEDGQFVLQDIQKDDKINFFQNLESEIDKIDRLQTKEIDELKIKLWKNLKANVRNQNEELFNKIPKTPEVLKITDDSFLTSNIESVLKNWKYLEADTQNRYFENLVYYINNNGLNGILGPESIMAGKWIQTKPKARKQNLKQLSILVSKIWDHLGDNYYKFGIGFGNFDSVVSFTHELWMNADFDEKKEIMRGFTQKDEISDEKVNKFDNKLKLLSEKNKNLYNELDWKFLYYAIESGYTDEQLLRLTNYAGIQKFILKFKDNKIMSEGIKYIIEKDNNWILSLNKMFNKVVEDESSIKDIEYFEAIIKEGDIDSQLIQNFLSLLAEKERYFNIGTVEQLRNYSEIKKELSKKILEGKMDYIPETLQKYNKEELQKFAFLEYTYGIDLENAKELVKKFGSNAEELLNRNPDNLETQFLYKLKLIVESEKIDEIIEEKGLEEASGEGVDVRNIEGKIINIFEEIYNEKLYIPQEKELSNQELYSDNEGKEHKIDVYKIQGDFDMNLRVEGAYNGEWKEPDNYINYYNRPSIDYHGNCESYIGNDLIANARFDTGVMVGYNKIYKNCLTGCGPEDLHSNKYNERFCSYINKSQYMMPQEFKNHTRHSHNEMVKDRIIFENGNLVRYMPNYAVWIEEDTEEERNEPDWKEKREKDEKWIRTKKVAAQLGIPIVVIDREYFAKREMEKIELLQKIISGEEIENERYEEYLPQYQKMSKTQLIKEIITKFQNNRIGIQFNDKLNDKYFTQEQLEGLIKQIQKDIEKEESSKEKTEMHQALLETCKKESSLTESHKQYVFFDDIYRGYFAKIEMEKIELLQKIISGEEIENEKYKEYLPQYQKMSKTQLIEEIITKFENNRTKIQDNEKSRDKYFTQEQFEGLIKKIQKDIEKEESAKEKNEMYQALIETCKKGRDLIGNNFTAWDEQLEKKKNRINSFYFETIKQCEDKKKEQSRVQQLGQEYLQECITKQDVIDEERKFKDDIIRNNTHDLDQDKTQDDANQGFDIGND